MQNESSKKPAEKIPCPNAFLVETPPYKKFKVDKENFTMILQLEFYTKPIDCFCQTCQKESTFQRIDNHLPQIFNPRISPNYNISTEIEKNNEIPEYLSFLDSQDCSYKNMPSKIYALTERNFTLMFLCSRCNTNIVSFFFTIANSSLTKSGQYPSIADLERNKVKKYSSLLGEEKTEELNTALRLYSNGIGIGSFVYLRRVFEYLIELAHDEAKLSTMWDDNVYSTARIEDKILSLKDYLPQILIENRKVYSVLSKGIHELLNFECLEYFDPMKLMVELILDKNLEKKERDKKEKDAKNKLGSIIAKLK
jgi:hypothetical protein